jgi:hypothetical protein
LGELLEGRPEFEYEIVHRVYTLTRERAAELFGDEVASTVPAEGLVDVHTYATAMVAGDRLVLDVTFPGHLWDGHSDMEIAAARGKDVPAGDRDPWELKAELVAEHCDPAVREPFIAALERR